MTPCHPERSSLWPFFAKRNGVSDAKDLLSSLVCISTKLGAQVSIFETWVFICQRQRSSGVRPDARRRLDSLAARVPSPARGELALHGLAHPELHFHGSG
jgi:hypothetical protein